MDQINGTQCTKLNLWYLLLQTDILPRHKLFLCGYAVLNRTVWYIINCAQDWNCIYKLHSWSTFKTFSTIQWFLICDWLFIFLLHNYPSYNHNHTKLIKNFRRGVGGGGGELPRLPYVLYTALLDLYYVWL